MAERIPNLRMRNRVAMAVAWLAIGALAEYVIVPSSSRNANNANVSSARAVQQIEERAFDAAVYTLQGDENRLSLAKGSAETAYIADDKRDLGRLIMVTGVLMTADDHEGQVAGTPNLALQAKIEAAGEFSEIGQANAVAITHAQAAHR